MPKLDDQASGSEGGIVIVLSVPYLENISINDFQQMLKYIPEPYGRECLHGAKASSPYIPPVGENS